MDTKGGGDKLNFFQNFFFPIHRYEIKKFLQLFLILFCVSCNYALIRIIKDSFVLGESGTEAIYYLKAYGTIPFIILFTVIYSQICKYLDKKGRFYFVIIYLVLFFIFFLLLYPYLDNLKIYYVDKLEKKIPSLRGLWALIKNWHLSLFYIHAELWGTFSMIAFWTLANDVTTTKQSGRFYSFLQMASNIASIIAGSMTAYLFKGDAVIILWTFIFIGLICIILYKFFSENLYDYETDKIKKNKLKLSIKESFLVLSKSKYLLYLSIIVIACNMYSALLESLVNEVWVEYTNKDKDLLSKLGGIKIMFVGIVSVVFSFIATFIQRKNWKIAAFFTPVSFLIFFSIFFVFSYFFDTLNSFGNTIFNIPALTLLVIIGTINVILARTSKYTFFGPTKEAVYIPLGEEEKIRGKAAVDGIGHRLGKGLGSILLTLIFFPLGGGSIRNCKTLIAITIFIICLGWIYTLTKLSKSYLKLISKSK